MGKSSHSSASAPTVPAVVASFVRAGASVRFVALGASMWPTVRSGALVEISPRDGADGPAPGELVAFEREGTVVVHRVVRRTAIGVIVRGDAMATEETVTRGQVLGAARVVRQPRWHVSVPTWAHVARLWHAGRAQMRRAWAQS